jgi:hypothetical protein
MRMSCNCMNHHYLRSQSFLPCDYSPFWVVWASDPAVGTIKTKHYIKENAIKEAEQRAAENPGIEFFIALNFAVSVVPMAITSDLKG